MPDASVAVSSNGLAKPLAAPDQPKKKCPGDGPAVSCTVEPYRYGPVGGFNSTWPFPFVNKFRGVPDNACMVRDRSIRTVVTLVVSVLSPVQRTNVQPLAAVAVSVTRVLLR